jgi:hypothetical protein
VSQETECKGLAYEASAVSGLKSKAWMTATFSHSKCREMYQRGCLSLCS